MATARIRETSLGAAAAVLLMAGAAVAGCGQASVSGAAPAANTARAGQGNASGAVSAGHASTTPSPGSGTGGPGAGPGSPGGGSPAAERVCSNPGAVRTVEVTRIPGLRQPGAAGPQPTTAPAITITSRARSVALAKAICALPRMPRGVLGCPIDIGGGFHLVFATSHLQLPAVMIRASGCETEVGASPGRPRWIVPSGGFWATFARLTGIKAPAHHL